MLTLAIVEDDPVCAAQLKKNVERFCREHQIALQLKTLTQSLAGWISAGQCFLMEASGRPGGWFVLQLPAPGDYPVANRRKSGAKATVYTPLPRATIWGPIPAPFQDSFALSSYCLRFFIFCEAADIISCNKDRAVFEIEAATKPGNPLFGGEPGRASGTDNRCPTLGC